MQIARQSNHDWRPDMPLVGRKSTMPCLFKRLFCPFGKSLFCVAHCRVSSVWFGQIIFKELFPGIPRPSARQQFWDHGSI
eukprot:1919286-Amphidinium_carterae.1